MEWMVDGKKKHVKFEEAIQKKDVDNFRRSRMMIEKRELFKEIVEEVIEDIALSKAIEEGRRSDFVSKDEIMEIFSK